MINGLCTRINWEHKWWRSFGSTKILSILRWSMRPVNCGFQTATINIHSLYTHFANNTMRIQAIIHFARQSAFRHTKPHTHVIRNRQVSSPSALKHFAQVKQLERHTRASRARQAGPGPLLQYLLAPSKILIRDAQNTQIHKSTTYTRTSTHKRCSVCGIRPSSSFAT